MGKRLCSAAYLARNVAPKNKITMPMRARGLPPLIHAIAFSTARSTAVGSKRVGAGLTAGGVLSGRCSKVFGAGTSVAASTVLVGEGACSTIGIVAFWVAGC